MGGTFYAQEAPHLPAFVTAGGHFDKSDPLYVIEVMKMYNKVTATFAGTVTEVLVESGVVVRKGQPLFKIRPTRSSSRRIPPKWRAGGGRAPAVSRTTLVADPSMARVGGGCVGRRGHTRERGARPAEPARHTGHARAV